MIELANSKYINRITGKFGPRIETQRQIHLNIAFGNIDQEIKRKKGPEKTKPGKRAEFLAQYKAVGYEKAKKGINNGFGREVFNDETLKKWIKEENEK